MIQYICDGCRTKLEGDDLASAAEFTRLHNESNGITAENGKPGRQELFCPQRCQPHAKEFWAKTRTIESSAYLEMGQKIQKFKNRFFFEKLAKKKAAG